MTGGKPGPGTPAGGSGGGTAPPPAAGAGSYAPATVRRLTPREINNSIRDVLLAGGAFEAPFQSDAGRHDFDNQYGGLNVTLRFAEDLQGAAEKAGSAFVARLAQGLPCSGKATTAAAESACAGELVDLYGPRLFRRPVAAEEKQNLLAVFAASRKDGDFASAAAAIVEAMIQSPNFVFRTELGDGAGPAVTLAPYELASALSYALWRSAPDQALLDAARTGKLATREDAMREAKRLLADPRAKEGLRDFFFQWLEISHLVEGLEKGEAGFSPAVAQAMVTDASKVIEEVVFAGDGTIASLFSTPVAFVNADLAKIYGLPAPAGGATTKVTVDGTRKGGILTTPAFLTVHAPPIGSSPIFRGLFVRTKLFCQTLPQPPDDIPAPSKDPKLSTREKFAMHSNSPSCKGCHDSMDPIGHGFERYDAIGRYREAEVVAGRTIPLSGEGELVNTDVDGKFTGAAALAAKLAGSAQVKDCVTGHLLKYLVGRDTARPDNRLAVDAQVIAGAVKGQGGGSLKDMLVALVGSPSFLHRDATKLPVKGGQR